MCSGTAGLNFKVVHCSGSVNSNVDGLDQDGSLRKGKCQ